MTIEEKITNERLKGEKLSAVWFVHDYIRLVFQFAWLDFNAMPIITIAGQSYCRSDFGYCNTLCDLIEVEFANVSITNDDLTLTFRNGTEVGVSFVSGEYHGSETVIFEDGNGLSWVL